MAMSFTTHIFASQEAVYATDWLWSELEKSFRDQFDIYPWYITIAQTPEELKTIVDIRSQYPNKYGKLGYIFFFHWSWIVPAEIYENYECVVIHTANLPEGRGGTPLQNQIVNGVWQSHVNAMKMIKELDAGPIYARIPITMQGTINDIWMTIAHAGQELIIKMLTAEPKLVPIPQVVTGNEQKYHRRKDNEIHFEQYDDTESDQLHKIYDFIRMLDGGTYPNAYVDLGRYRLEFTRASFSGPDEQILADVKITSRYNKKIKRSLD